MKRVKLRTIMAGPKRTVAPGDIIEVTDAEAKSLIMHGFASEVEKVKEPELELEEEPVPESTSAPVEPETTSKPAVRKYKSRSKSKRKK